MSKLPSSNESGYVAYILVALFVAVTSFVLMPKTFSPPKPVNPRPAAPAPPGSYCIAVPDSEATTFSAPEDNNTKCPDGEGGSYKSGGVKPDNDFGGNTTYKLIRKNVPINKAFFTDEERDDHSTLATDAGINSGPDPSKYRLYFPRISGEIDVGQAPYSRTRHCGDASYQHTGRLYFIDYGLAFALILQNGNPIEVSGTDMGGGGRTFYLADVYKDIQRDMPQDVQDKAFKCAQGSAAAAPPPPPPPNQGIITPPNEPVSPDKKEVQLQYFTFNQTTPPPGQIGGVSFGWYDSCKPAIYLYPKQKQLVNVKVFTQGEFTYTDPVYNPKSGWNVIAYPSGTIENLGDNQNSKGELLSKSGLFDYLYYESRLPDNLILKPTKGWVVKFEELTNLYENILPKLGLNSKQMADFIDYWQKSLPYSPYYFVGIMDQEDINSIEPLEITPKPDHINRVRMYFERLSEPKLVEAPQLTGYQFPANNYHAIEWGGMVKNDPNHPFTCSQ